MNRLGITDGEWIDTPRGGDLRRIKDMGGRDICDTYSFISCIDSEEQQCNAKLIADAGTTANKCGLLPSELLDQRNELLEACICSFKTFISIGVTMEAEIMVELNNAIKKAEQYGNVLH